jgi:hypothetical protein
MDDLPTRDLLGAADVDRLAAAVHLLLGEVALLSERVAALEGAAPEQAQERITRLTEWVLSPLGQ